MALALALIVVIVGCSDDGGDNSSAIPSDCGLPSPDPTADVSLVAEALLLHGEAQLLAAAKERGGFLASIAIPMSVTDGLARYKTELKQLGYELISQDNEIFEAELYLRKGKNVGAIQIRRSVCDDASIVFVNVISQRHVGKQVPLPIPSGARSPSPIDR